MGTSPYTSVASSLFPRGTPPPGSWISLPRTVEPSSGTPLSVSCSTGAGTDLPAGGSSSTLNGVSSGTSSVSSGAAGAGPTGTAASGSGGANPGSGTASLGDPATSIFTTTVTQSCCTVTVPPAPSSTAVVTLSLSAPAYQIPLNGVGQLNLAISGPTITCDRYIVNTGVTWVVVALLFLFTFGFPGYCLKRCGFRSAFHGKPSAEGRRFLRWTKFWCILWAAIDSIAGTILTVITTADDQPCLNPRQAAIAGTILLGLGIVFSAISSADCLSPARSPPTPSAPAAAAVPAPAPPPPSATDQQGQTQDAPTPESEAHSLHKEGGRAEV